MKPSKPNDTNQGQSINQNQQQATEGARPNGPPAAAKRDVQEAERKAENAEQRAGEAQRIAVEETENLRQSLQEKIDQLEEQLEETVTLLEQLNTNVEEVIDNTGSMSAPKRDFMDEYKPVDCSKVRKDSDHESGA